MAYDYFSHTDYQKTNGNFISFCQAMAALQHIRHIRILHNKQQIHCLEAPSNSGNSMQSFHRAHTHIQLPIQVHIEYSATI
jgi:hypothetical protein